MHDPCQPLHFAFYTLCSFAFIGSAPANAAITTQPQDGVLEWIFDAQHAPDGFSATPASPALRSAAKPQLAPDEAGGGLICNDLSQVMVVANQEAGWGELLPSQSFTVEAWVAIEGPQRWGGIVGCVQDNGEAEKGWILGFDDERFTFGLATEGADDGDGKITYLAGRTAFQPGRLHYVVATYDGEQTNLYVDGQLDGTSSGQSGPILFDPTAVFAIGSYLDQNENNALDGRLKQIRLQPGAKAASDVKQEYMKHAERILLLPIWTDMKFEFLVQPYLTWPTLDSISVLFETTFPSEAKVNYWPAGEADKLLNVRSEPSALHEFRLQGLEPDQKYFYQVSATDPNGVIIQSPLLSFRTAASEDKAFTFVVIGDTQTHGDVAKRVSDVAWMHRPNLVIHAGDLVDTGTSKRDWTHTFFPSMQPLIGRVPIMPVLGNHEQDAPHYYRYMSLPEPERWYSFRYGNAEFFMIDGNRSLEDQSAQFAWLEGALKASTATWRFAILHQPPFTSDSDDYGDTFTTTSKQGDPNVRNIVRLLETYGVDLCFSGHVHDYERTFPIRENQVTAYEDGGVIYVTAAGGGGSLENFDPANTWFGHKKARYHHLVYVAIHGKNLEFQAIDERGRLFDTLQLEKRPSPKLSPTK